jgi:hypothetical protein
MRFRRNLITSLETAEGCIVTDHNAKAKLIWDSFKERLGVSSFQGMLFNLNSLLQTDHDLSFLVNPF